MPKLSYDNVTMLDNMTRQCDTVMSPDGHDSPTFKGPSPRRKHPDRKILRNIKKNKTYIIES